MKKYLGILLLSAFSVFTGCTMEETLLQDERTDQSNGKEITIRATREGYPETRTVRNADGSVWWTPGDAISLFYGSGTDGGSKFTSNATEISEVTNFTGIITAITGGGEISVDETYFWGVYPYNDDVSCDGSSVTLTLPSQQTAVPGTFANGLFPSLGRSQGLTMGFYNICGGWRFSVTKEGVRKVTLKSNGGELITGRVKVGFDYDGKPEVREIIDGSDEVVLECPRGEYFEVGKNYYMVLLPTVFNSGFTMTFETYTEEGVYNRTARTPITRSKFSGVTNVDTYLTTPYALKTGNIPVEDANFKAYLVSNFDGNGDGEINYEEAAAIESLSLNTRNIKSLAGIEYMIGLTSLYNNSNQLTSIDLSNNTALTDLCWIGGQLTSLDVSNNTALTRLSCYSNQLTSINVSGNTALTTLACFNNQLTSIDVSRNTALTTLSCQDNQLISLDVSNNTALTDLSCSGNQLTSLDVSNNTALTTLSCFHNQLTSLDVSNNTALTFLNCFGNPLTSIDVSNNAALEYLGCSDNQLTSLDVSNNTALDFLGCSDNQLTSLDVSNNTALASLYCYGNQLASLDVSKNTALAYLDCAPMSSLETLYIHQGQEIPKVTVNRNNDFIPAETQILIAPANGGNESTGDQEVNP